MQKRPAVPQAKNVRSLLCFGFSFSSIPCVIDLSTGFSPQCHLQIVSIAITLDSEAECHDVRSYTRPAAPCNGRQMLSPGEPSLTKQSHKPVD